MPASPCEKARLCKHTSWRFIKHLFIHEHVRAIFPRVISIPACVYKLSPRARTKLDTLMPIETVNISYNEPQPGAPVVAFEDPVISEVNTVPYKTVSINLNKRIGHMTPADLRKYRQWLERVPGILHEKRYHPNFIAEFCKQANNLAEIIQTHTRTRRTS